MSPDLIRHKTVAPAYRRIPPLGPGKRPARQRILAQWRGVDLAPLEKARASTARSAAEVLPKVLGTVRIDKRQAEAEIVKVWNNSLDPNVVKHAQPTGLNKGTLFVTVDSSVWLAEIVRYRRREILERLQHSFGKDLVSKISFRVG
jgi:predicted nucleic acid-binding Zn ribbon protein